MEVMNNNKKLYRSRQRMIGGVCGGLAEFLDTDPTVIRLIAVVLFFLRLLPAVLCYLVAWAIIPERP